MSELEAIVQMITARLGATTMTLQSLMHPARYRQLSKRKNQQNVPAPPESNEFPIKALQLGRFTLG